MAPEGSGTQPPGSGSQSTATTSVSPTSGSGHGFLRAREQEPEADWKGEGPHRGCSFISLELKWDARERVSAAKCLKIEEKATGSGPSSAADLGWKKNNGNYLSGRELDQGPFIALQREVVINGEGQKP